MIVDFFRHPADDLHLIDRFHPHSQILFDKGRVNDGTADSHTDRPDLQIRFAPHGCHRHGGASETEQLLLHILRDFRVIRVLQIMAIDSEGRKPLLRMGSQHGSQIDGARPLRAVESPDPLDRQRIHIHRFRSIAPARRDGQGNIHAFSAELIRTGRCLSHPSDGGVRDHHLYRLSVGIA